MCIAPTGFFGVLFHLNMPRNRHCIMSHHGIECWVIQTQYDLLKAFWHFSTQTMSCMLR
uniref:Uncharacterized protein n=1 Tax=Arundo donax TaxID=35708 RepID=A0A0A9GHC8_ARUDO